ncbi:MAG: histidinol-phosphatase HisJ family protein [Erysipelotrichaceae bacterium]|nr:histidinol-phosphatase HisJ family protein [Erysipelotrichaceae bacterium]
MADYHVHSNFSEDCDQPMEDQIRQAISLGLDEICFCEHVDYGIKFDWDEGQEIRYRIINETIMVPNTNCHYPNYFKELQRMKQLYGNSITIKQGLEFGIQTSTIDDFNKLFHKYEDQLDFILLSIHQIGNKELWTQDFQKNRTQDEYNRMYYEELLKLVQTYDDFSVLAHMDLIVRYDNEGVYPFEKVKDLITEILKTVIAKGKGIEFNTSSWRYGLSDTHPSGNILKLYKELGGTIITIGSDAHKTTQVGEHFTDAIRILKELGFTEYCTFEKRKPVFHKL